MKTKSSNLVKMLSLMAMLVFMAPLMIVAGGGKTDFSGTWALNRMESSPSVREQVREMIVKQDSKNLITTTAYTDGRSVVRKYSLDGKESVNMEGYEESMSTAKFSSDGKKLTIFTRTYHADEEKTDQDVWSISGSGLLTIECTTAGTSGDEVSRFVFNRK